MSKVNVPMALMSLLVSILLWANIYNFSKNPTKTDTLTLSLSAVNIDETKYVISEIPSEVAITVAGTKDQLSSASSQNRSAIVDLGTATVGNKNYAVLVFPPKLRELLVSAGLTARVKIDALATKELPIVVKRLGATTDKSGFEVETRPKSVYVTGPADLIRKISAVQVSTEFAGLVATLSGAELQPLAIDNESRSLSKVLFSSTGTGVVYNEVKLSEPFLVWVRIRPTAITGLP